LLGERNSGKKQHSQAAADGGAAACPHETAPHSPTVHLRNQNKSTSPKLSKLRARL
jgi:hypothetical protein